MNEEKENKLPSAGKEGIKKLSIWQRISSWWATTYFGKRNKERYFLIVLHLYRLGAEKRVTTIGYQSSNGYPRKADVELMSQDAFKAEYGGITSVGIAGITPITKKEFDEYSEVSSHTAMLIVDRKRKVEELKESLKSKRNQRKPQRRQQKKTNVKAKK